MLFVIQKLIKSQSSGDRRMLDIFLYVKYDKKKIKVSNNDENISWVTLLWHLSLSLAFLLLGLWFDYLQDPGLEALADRNQQVIKVHLQG